jgi:hypothetical protein
MSRNYRELVFTFAAGADTSTERRNLADGAFGTLIVPSSLNGNTLQVLADIGISADLPSNTGLTNAPLLSTAKALVTGGNGFTAAELTQVGAAGHVRLRLGTAAVAETRVVLLWKS